MKNITDLRDGWFSSHQWVKRHDSGLFAMEVRVNGEYREGQQSSYCPPRNWCSYLIGGDTTRYYRDGVSDMHIIKCKITDLVFNQGESLFSGLGWNYGVTMFETSVRSSFGFKDVRQWKVGDDYQHFYDTDRWNYYDFTYISRNIELIGDEFYELIKSKGLNQ